MRKCTKYYVTYVAVCILMCVGSCHAAGTLDITKGLAGCWTFEDKDNPGRDTSGHNHHAVLHGPVWGKDEAGSGVLKFDGTDDHIDLGTVKGYGFGPECRFTVSLWVKYSAKGGRKGHYIIGRFNNSKKRWVWVIKTRGHLLTYFLAEGGERHTIAGALENDTWCHIAVVAGANGEPLACYLNGVKTLAKTAERKMDRAAETDSLRIGGPPFFKGDVDDVRIYNRALSQEEISALNAQLTKPPRVHSQEIFIFTKQTRSVTLRSHEPNSKEKLAYTIVKPPEHGSLTGDAPKLTYTPKPGFTGRDSFIFSANDGTFKSNEATVTVNVRRPAFPGAEGYGALAKGGRGGKVIKVTNLNPQGPGSFSEALGAQGPRIIVFDVSGVIPKGRGGHGGYPGGGGHLTIAGQTAPGPGIAIEGKLAFGGVRDVIVRNLRIRYTGRDGGDAILVSNCTNVIFDHCAVSWGADESLSPIHSKNVTVQWTTIEESRLCWEGGDEPHNFGMIFSGGPGTLNHILFAHHHSRAPAAQYGILIDYRNSVIYNHGTSLGLPPGGGNVVGNYLKDGPGALFGYPRIYNPPGTLTKPGLGVKNDVYMEGNYRAYSSGYWEPGSGESMARPVEAPAVTMHVAEEAYEQVLACGGPLPRDEITGRCIYEVRTRTGLWDEQFPRGDWRARMAGGKPKPDADNDGMPDAWETAHSLDPNDPADAKKTVPAGASEGDRHQGYTYIEYYINALADMRKAEALTAYRLNGHNDCDKEPPKPEWKDLPKPVDELVAEIDRHNMALHKKSPNDTGKTWRAIWMLKDAGPGAAAAVKPLARIMDTNDNRKALFAAWALGVIAPFADEKVAVPVLIKGLERTDYVHPVTNRGWHKSGAGPNPRGFIAWALGRFGERAEDAVPALATTMFGKDGWARQPAAWALLQMGPKAKPATAALIRALESAEGTAWGTKGGCRFHAARALARIGRSAVPGLVKALGETNTAKRIGALTALRLIGADARVSLPEVIQCLKHGDPGVRSEAAGACAGVAPADKETVSALSKALGDKDYSVRNNAAKALGLCAAVSQEAVAPLEKALADPKREVRYSVFRSLGKGGTAAVPVLAKALESDDAWNRKYAARALGDAGRNSDAAVSACIKALSDRDGEVRREAVWSLGLIGPKAHKAESALKKAASDDADCVVRYAADAVLKRFRK